MRYYYLDRNRRKVGPFTLEELRQWHQEGVIRPDTELVAEDGYEVFPFRDLWGEIRNRSEGVRPPPIPPEAGRDSQDREESFAEKAGADLRELIPHLLMPFEELKGWRWLENHRMIAIAAIGLLPLVVITMFAGQGDLRGAYWAIAFYFSALWGTFFYFVFPAPYIRLKTSVICFLGTGFASISILLVLYALPPFNLVPRLIQSENLLVHLVTFICFVGIPEEACKALVLFLLAWRLGAVPPKTMMFYGLMSGLGFGIYEGVGYQMGRNYTFSSGSGEYYYLLNLIRLTSLPFLHAIWTGIAGYFIGFATQYPRRRYGLWVVAVGFPGLVHGLYNTFSASILGFGFALLGVLALNLYFAKSMEFDRALQRDAGEDGL